MTLESAIDPARFVPQNQPAARTALGLPVAGRLIGVCGGLDPGRGIGDVYRVFVRLAAKDAHLHLVLAGKPDRRARPPEHPRVHLLGRLAHGQMPLFYGALDLALVPMRDSAFGRYAFPQKLYEILGCGTPILAARVGAMARTLAAFPECLYAPDDPVALEARMRRQLTSPVRPDVVIPSWQEQVGRLEPFLIGAKARGVADCRRST
jgi:teichuronic acid biosynthesis glycosyltransferase TuaC